MFSRHSLSLKIKLKFTLEGQAKAPLYNYSDPINNAFGVYSDHVQDIIVRRHVALALIACIVVPVFELLQSNTDLKNLSPWVPGPRVLGSSSPWVPGPRVPGLVFIVSPAVAV